MSRPTAFKIKDNYSKIDELEEEEKEEDDMEEIKINEKFYKTFKPNS